MIFERSYMLSYIEKLLDEQVQYKHELIRDVALYAVQVLRSA